MKIHSRISATRVILDQRTLSRAKIVDFPRTTPVEKQPDFGAMLRFLNGFVDLSKQPESRSPVTDISNPSLSPNYAEQVMDEHRLLHPFKLLPGWRHSPISIRLACMHALFSVQPLGVFKPFTLNFRGDIVDAAYKYKDGPRAFFQNRVHEHLNSLAPALFWQGFEISDQGVFHSHGGLHLAEDVPDRVILRALQSAGGAMEGKARGTQARFSEPIPNREAEWATYARKDPVNSDRLFGGSAYSGSRELRRAGREFYESVRQFLNSQRRVLEV